MNFSFYKPLNFSEKSALDDGSNVKRQKLRSYSDYFFERFISSLVRIKNKKKSTVGYWPLYIISQNNLFLKRFLKITLYCQKNKKIYKKMLNQYMKSL